MTTHDEPDSLFYACKIIVDFAPDRATWSDGSLLWPDDIAAAAQRVVDKTEMPEDRAMVHEYIAAVTARIAAEED